MVAVDALTSDADLRAITAEWNALAARDPAATPYQSADVALGLWRIITPQVSPCVLTARDPGGRLVGVLPAGIHRKRIGPLQLRLLGPLVLWFASYFDATVEASRPDVSRMLLTTARTRQLGADAIAFPHLRPDAHLASASPRAGGYLLGREATRHEIPLTAAGGDAGRSAREIGRTWRRLRELEPDAQYENLATAAGITAWMPQFGDLHRRRWAGTPTPSLFAADATTAAFTDWFAQLAEAARAELHVLRTPDRLLAGLCVFRGERAIYGWRQAADASFSSHGLGIQLTQQAMQAAGARGDTLYDMGRGAESYKDTWRAHETSLLRARAPGTGLRWSLLQRTGQLVGRPWTEQWLQAVDAAAIPDTPRSTATPGG